MAMIYRLLYLLTLCLSFSFTACTGDDGDVPADAGEDASTAADVGDDATPDGSDPSDVAEAGAFEIGTNCVEDATPQGFLPITEGGEVPLTWGVQGSWMVVMAFRTHDMFEGVFDVRAEITIDGRKVGEIWYEAQESFPGGDGWDYYYSLFLAIDLSDPPPRGTPAHVVMTVTDEDGTTATREHDVVIGEADGP